MTRVKDGIGAPDDLKQQDGCDRDPRKPAQPKYPDQDSASGGRQNRQENLQIAVDVESHAPDQQRDEPHERAEELVAPLTHEQQGRKQQREQRTENGKILGEGVVRLEGKAEREL